MSDVLRDRRVAILATDGVERVELEQPSQAVEDAARRSSCCRSTTARSRRATTTSRTRGPSRSTASSGTPPSTTTTRCCCRAAPSTPTSCGWTSAPSTSCASSSSRASRVAAICHGPWTLLEAGVLPGRRITSFPSLRTDLRNAGAHVVDEQVVVDEGLVSSRSPDDLPVFCEKVVEEFAEGRHAGRVERTAS